MYQAGIVGLPGVGKTSLFNLLTRAGVQIEKYQRQTHIGVARVPDPRLEKLGELVRPRKVTPATFEYVDIAGGLEGQMRDAQVRAHLRNVNVLNHVVRAFPDPDSPDPVSTIHPARDIDALEVEMMLADLETISRRLERLQKDLKKMKSPELEGELHLLARLKEKLEKEIPLREVELREEEKKIIRGFMFLSEKPILYVLNVDEAELPRIGQVAALYALEARQQRPQAAVTGVCARIESELAELEPSELDEFLQNLGLREPALHRILRETYRLLGLISFFTTSDEEVRASTVRRDSSAQKAAGAVHSEMERGFIRAEVVRFDDFVKAGSFAAARDKGLLRVEGKEYRVQDGDVIHFRFAV